MQAVIIGLTIINILVLLSTWGVWLVFPGRRKQLERSAWFAFAPLVFGLIGLLLVAIVVLFGNADTTSPALASNGAIILFNLYNGYRSVEAYYRNRQRH